jgi:ABC-type branched-subunit amino acid transport system ATPase component
MDMAFGFAENVTVMSQGKVVAQGPKDEVRTNRDVQQIYLGAPAD